MLTAAALLELGEMEEIDMVFLSLMDQDLHLGRHDNILAIVVPPTGIQPDLPVAVGTPVTRRPPHRSLRAELPHKAPTLGV